jgi:hypothetical protein
MTSNSLSFYIMLRYYKIKAGTKQYYVSIKTKYGFKDGEPISYYFDFGGKMKGCVQITAEVPDTNLATDERFAELEKAKYLAFISWIGYNSKCSIMEDLPSGEAVSKMHPLSWAIWIDLPSS